MRKKLLALLMCATMVLGTGVTAFADDTSDTVDKIVGSNAKKFDGEVTANSVNGKVTDTVRYASTDGNVYTLTIGYDTNKSLAPVVLNSDGKAATKVDDSYNATETVNASGDAKNAVLKAYSDNSASGTVAVTLTTTANDKLVYVTDGTTVTATEFVEGAPNYVESVDKSVSLLQGNKKILSSSNVTFGTIWTNVAVVATSDSQMADLKLALYEAVDSKEITANALAVKLTPYVQYTFANVDLGIDDKNGNDVKCKEVTTDFSNFVGGTYTLDADLLSNTKLAGDSAVAVYKFTGYNSQYSELLGVINGFQTVATAAEVGSSYSFDNVTTLSGIFVFDKAASSSDSTTAATEASTTANNGKSDKTGDVAPIAALAVVMMGACGAMVVASKKRA